MSEIGNMFYTQRCHLFRPDIIFFKLFKDKVIDIFNTKSYNLTNQLRDESYEKKEKQELLLLLP